MMECDVFCVCQSVCVNACVAGCACVRAVLCCVPCGDRCVVRCVLSVAGGASLTMDVRLKTFEHQRVCLRIHAT